MSTETLAGNLRYGPQMNGTLESPWQQGAEGANRPVTGPVKLSGKRTELI